MDSQSTVEITALVLGFLCAGLTGASMLLNWEMDRTERQMRDQETRAGEPKPETTEPESTPQGPPFIYIGLYEQEKQTGSE